MNLGNRVALDASQVAVNLGQEGPAATRDHVIIGRILGRVTGDKHNGAARQRR